MDRCGPSMIQSLHSAIYNNNRIGTDFDSGQDKPIGTDNLGFDLFWSLISLSEKFPKSAY